MGQRSRNADRMSHPQRVRLMRFVYVRMLLGVELGEGF